MTSTTRTWTTLREREAERDRLLREVHERLETIMLAAGLVTPPGLPERYTPEEEVHIS
jgi:hypothetical protein